MINNSKNSLKIFLMGGTKDSINIIKFLKEEYTPSNSDLPYILTTTTTDYGGKLAKEAGSDELISYAMGKDEIVEILNNYSDGIGFDILIDATHPFAENATSTAIEAAKIANVNYIRFERPTFDYSKYDNIHLVDSFKEVGELLVSNFEGKNILHLAGVNTIEMIFKSNIAKENFYARVLPVISSIEKCDALGIDGEHIIAMQGVFSKEFNKELMKELNIEVILTKESGAVGGVPSKIEAAYELGIDVILVNRPKIANLDDKNTVNNLSELNKKLNSFLNQ